MPFIPRFTITSQVAQSLMRIEGVKQAIQSLPVTPSVLLKLRETARLYSTHYSTMIEGNRLTQIQVEQVLDHQQHFPDRERDEKEVLGYYAALEKVERLAVESSVVTERQIQNLHALVTGGGRKRVRPSSYRDGQNVIRDGMSGRIVYMPPEAHDVPKLMGELVQWLKTSADQGLPCPIRAAIAHYQYATIHPYYDGNGRTGRLLTTLVMHLGGYDLKGLYSLEEYYARNLGAYYDALTIGPSHNYYGGRAEADITKWVEYFCTGAAESFRSVQKRAEDAAGTQDRSGLLRKLDPRQRMSLQLFLNSETITSRDVERLLAVSQRTARDLLRHWTAAGFVIVADPAKKSRKYKLSDEFEDLI